MSTFRDDSYRDQDLPFPGEEKQGEGKPVAEGENSANAAPDAATVEMARVLMALQRRGMGFVRPKVRYRSSATLFGTPLLAIAKGPDLEKGEMYGHARGIIAIGDVATGVFALGGMARGIFALGGMALGCITLGGGSMGLLLSIGGFSLGGIAVGGCAIGGVALGGCAIGGFAAGGMAIGYYAVGGQAIGMHVMSPLKQDPAVKQLIEGWLPFLKGLAGK